MCGTRVGLGRGKTENYKKTHKNTPTCLALKAKAEREEKKRAASFAKPDVKPNQSMLSFIKVIPKGQGASRLSEHKTTSKPEGSNAIAGPSSRSYSTIGTPTPPTPFPTPTVALAKDLQCLIARLPHSIPEGVESNALAAYANPQSLDYPGIYSEAIWEAGLNRSLKDGLGWGDGKIDWDVVIQRGPWGVDALVGLVEYFVDERGVPESLFQGKLTLIKKA